MEVRFLMKPQSFYPSPFRRKISPNLATAIVGIAVVCAGCDASSAGTSEPAIETPLVETTTAAVQPLIVPSTIDTTVRAPAEVTTSTKDARKAFLPHPPPSNEELADRRISNVGKHWDRHHPTTVVEGIVESSNVQAVPTSEADQPYTIVTRYTMRVSNAWGNDPGASVEFWVKGGILPEDHPPSADYPRGLKGSAEFYPEIGDRILIGLTKKELVRGLNVQVVAGGDHGAIVLESPSKNAAVDPKATAGQSEQDLVKSTSLKAFRSALAQKSHLHLDKRFTRKVSH
jgi:hypothetical protein